MIDRIVVWALSLKARASEERGQDIMEYAILTGGIAVALLVALAIFVGADPGAAASPLGGFFNRIANFVNDLGPS
jgi:Flp pilus assembly pilin Flp